MDRGELLALLQGLRQWPPPRARPRFTDWQVGVVMIVVALLGGFAIGYGAHRLAHALTHDQPASCTPVGVARCSGR